MAPVTLQEGKCCVPAEKQEALISKSKESEASDSRGTMQMVHADGTGERKPEPGDGSTGEIKEGFPLDKTDLRRGLDRGTRGSQCTEG